MPAGTHSIKEKFLKGRVVHAIEGRHIWMVSSDVAPATQNYRWVLTIKEFEEYFEPFTPRPFHAL